MLDEKLQNLNLQWDSLARFVAEDKHLRDLKSNRYIFDYELDLKINQNGIYILFGGRQIGKTTALKSLIKKFCAANVEAKNSLYLNCDLIIDRRELELSLTNYYNSIDRTKPSLIILDEITPIKDWQLTIKGIIDLGFTRESIVVITGSDKIVLEDAAAGFPGVNRRAAGKDISISPLSFKQFCDLVSPNLAKTKNTQEFEKEINLRFEEYLYSGGYLSAINARDAKNEISSSVMEVYKQWILSDFIKKGKDRQRLLEILRLLIERYGSQLSFTKIAQESLALTTDTVIRYIDQLERLDTLIVLSAFDQNRKTNFPKKDRKFHASDPFILQVIIYWLKQEGILASDFEIDRGHIVESVVVAAHRNKGKLFYIKAEGEVDLVVLKDGGFQPIEVKWTKQLRERELKQIIKYPNGLILSQNLEAGEFKGVKCRNLVEYLYFS